MGIKNFRSYAKTFFGQRCFEEFDVGRIAGYYVRDFSRLEVCLRAVDKSAECGKQTETYGRCGLYVDLDSLQYGCLLRSLENNEHEGGGGGSCFTTDVEEGETDTVVAKIAADCAETLIDTLGPLLTKAYRVYLAYDTGSPRAKSYEQAGRKRRTRFSLTYATRVACYERIVNAVREAASLAHRANLRKFTEGESGLLAAADPEVLRQTVESAVTVQFPPDAVSFGEGEWKCFYRMHEDITEGAVDTCFVFGRDWDIGFAMTMYQHPKTPSGIKYVYGPSDMLRYVKRFDARERALHFACFVLVGNDYVSRLVNPSDENLRLLKTEFDRIYENAGGEMTARQIDYLSATLFFEGDGGTEEDAAAATGVSGGGGGGVGDPETRIKLSVAFATVFARLLSAVYTALPDEIDKALLTISASAIAERQTLRLHRHRSCRARTGVKEETTPTVTTTSGTRRTHGLLDGTAVLACKNAQGGHVPRTFQQCMDSFATTALWYLSYTRFYFFSKNGRDTFARLKRRTDDGELKMHVGLRMAREDVFSYNDSRLSPSCRYDVRRLLEVKNILRCTEPDTLFWILQSAFEHALESKRS